MIRRLGFVAATAVAVGLSGWPSRADAPECALDGANGGPMLGVTGLDPRAFEELTGIDVQMLHIFVPRREGWEPLRGLGPSGRLEAIERALARRPEATVLISYPPVEKVCGYVKAAESNVLHHAYFDRDNDAADHRLESHPRSLEAFRAHCRPQPPAC